MVYGTQSINESVGCVAHKVYNKLNVKGKLQRKIILGWCDEWSIMYILIIKSPPPSIS